MRTIGRFNDAAKKSLNVIILSLIFTMYGTDGLIFHEVILYCGFIPLYWRLKSEIIKCISNTTTNYCYSLTGFCNLWIYHWLDAIVRELNNVYCITALLYCAFQQQFKILLECIQHHYNTIKREHSFLNNSHLFKSNRFSVLIQSVALFISCATSCWTINCYFI